MKNWETLEPDRVKLLSKHFTSGRGGAKIDKIVVHHNGGNLSIDSIWNVWQTRQASAHYQVTDTGQIGQLVWDRDTAWHAADSQANRTSIGIEHANSGSPTSPVTDATLENGAHLVAAICKRYNLGRPEWGRNVYPHKNFTSTDCPGHLAGDQNAEYMARAQYWYDQMTGTAPKPAPAPKAAPKPAPKAKPLQAPPFPLPRDKRGLFYYGPKTGPITSVSGMTRNTVVPRDVIETNGRWHSIGLARWQARMIERGWNELKSAGGADGRYGPVTEKVVRQFQDLMHLKADGKLGPETWAAAWNQPIK